MAFPTYGELILRQYSENPDSSVLRTEMETGPAKQAKVQSLAPVQRRVSLFFTGAEFETFKIWFKGSECNRGASWFDWLDPQTGTTKQARIVDGKYEALTTNTGEGSEIGWHVSMNLETLE